MYWPVEWIQGRRLRPLHELIAELGSYIGQRVWHVQCPGFLQSRKAAHFGGTRWNHDIQGDDNFSFDILLWLPPLSPATQQHPADNGFLYVVASPPYRSGFGLCFSILAWFVDVTPAHILCILELSAGAFPTLKAFYSLRFLFHDARLIRDIFPRLPRLRCDLNFRGRLCQRPTIGGRWAIVRGFSLSPQNEKVFDHLVCVNLVRLKGVVCFFDGCVATLFLSFTSICSWCRKYSFLSTSLFSRF